MSQASPSSAAPHSLEQLLRMGADAARGGNKPAARALFLALAREHPDDVRIWIGLAGVAASRNEQREALERIVALDPQNERASLALRRLTAAEEATPTGVTAVLPETIAAPAVTDDARAAAPTALPPDSAPGRTPFPLLNAIAMGLILLLLAALGVVLGRALLGNTGVATAPTTTPELILQPAPGGPGGAGAATAATAAPAPGGVAPGEPAQQAATAAPGSGGQAEGSSSQPTAAAQPSGATAAAPAPATPLAAGSAPTPPLAVTAQPAITAAADPGQALALPMGTPIDHDGWTAVLVRPDYVLPLDGAIGDLRPNGNFVLAVVAVSNNSPSPRVIPPDMFLLVDAEGRAYTPVPGASTAYLTLYERAQRGDLALEDTFEPVVGLRSVPVIFDVPPGVAGLRLTVNGAGPAGWPVGESASPAVPSGP